jgi:hypothetical protein
LTPSRIDSTKVVSSELRKLHVSAIKFREIKDDPSQPQNGWTEIKKELLAQALRVGIQKPPEVEELVDLCSFISREFKNLNINELRKAFSLYQAGKLDFTDNPYNTFSCLFVGNILGSFKRYKGTHLAKTQSKQLTDFSETQIDKKQYYEEYLFMKYDALLKGKYIFTEEDERHLYRKLTEGLHIKIATNREKVSAMEDADNQEPKKYRQNEQERDNKVKARAKRICFRNWINRMAFEEIDLRTEINKLI